MLSRPKFTDPRKLSRRDKGDREKRRPRTILAKCLGDAECSGDCCSNGPQASGLLLNSPVSSANFADHRSCAVYFLPFLLLFVVAHTGAILYEKRSGFSDYFVDSASAHPFYACLFANFGVLWRSFLTLVLFSLFWFTRTYCQKYGGSFVFSGFLIQLCTE